MTLVAKLEPSDAEGVLLTEAAAQASGGSRRESRLARGRGLVNAQQLVSVTCLELFGIASCKDRSSNGLQMFGNTICSASEARFALISRSSILQLSPIPCLFGFVPGV